MNDGRGKNLQNPCAGLPAVLLKAPGQWYNRLSRYPSGTGRGSTIAKLVVSSGISTELERKEVPTMSQVTHHQKVQLLVQFSMLLAIEALMCFVPWLGSIPWGRSLPPWL